MTSDPASLVKAKVNLETAKIPWMELQVFFAKGLAILVDEQLDLVSVAQTFALDDKDQVSVWLRQLLIKPVPDQLAKQWVSEQSLVWAVVVKPWILIQTVG